MNSAQKVLLIYYVASLAITLVPLPWWYYNVGGIFKVLDSPFQFSSELLGSYLIISDLINILLNAFRIYVAVNLVYGLAILLLRKEVVRYSTMAWLPVFYIIDPVLIYLILNYLVPSILGESISYPLVIIGSESFSTTYKNATIVMTIQSYPTTFYWLTLISPLTYLSFLILNHKPK